MARDALDFKAAGTAIVAAINAQTLTPAVTAERGFISLHDLQKLTPAMLPVRVLPLTVQDSGEGDRGGAYEQVGFTVQIARTCRSDQIDRLDETVALMQSIRELLEKAGEFDGLDVDAVEFGVGGGELFDVELLHQHHLFTGRVDIRLDRR